MLSATGFFGEFVAAARLNRRLLEASAEIDQRKRRFNESARARALRLNAYALASLDGELCWNLGDAVIRRRSVLACW